MKTLPSCLLLGLAACAHVPNTSLDPLTSWDDARAARLVERVRESVHCTGQEQGAQRIICAARVVERPEAFTTPGPPLSLLGVVVSVPESAPFRVRNDFGLSILRIGLRGARMIDIPPETRTDLEESEELIGQIYEVVSGQRNEPITIPSSVAARLQSSQEALLDSGYVRHSTFASLGADARIFYLESFGGHPAFAIVTQTQTEIQLALYPMIAGRFTHPEFSETRAMR